MGKHRDPDETRANYIEVLGPDFGAFYYALVGETVRLFTKWHQFRELFGTKPSRIDLLNRAAPHFFGLLQSSLFQDVLLHLARLLDPAESPGRGPRRNLTVCGLPGFVEDRQLATELASRIRAANEKSAFARDWRNRLLAHRDLEVALDPKASPLEPASRQRIAEGMEALVDVLDTIQFHYFGSRHGFGLGGDPGDAIRLLHCLQDGVDSQERRRERFRNGTATDEDRRPRPDL